ncbi:MAG: hypothetical protein ABIQ31_25300 [Ferruginibacter sp.]
MRYLITCMLVTIASVAFSQTVSLDSAEVKNATIEFNGGKYSGYTVELNAPPDIVEDAVTERFKSQGVKPKETKDFKIYRNVVMPLIDPSKPIDAFIKVERKSKSEKDKSIVYFIAAAPGGIPEDKVKSGAVASSSVIAVESGGAFLTGIIPDIKRGVHEKNVADQQSQLKKEEKKLASLQDDKEDMEKKLKKLQSDIEYNAKALERQAAEVEKAKSSLNDLISKTPK